MLLMVRIYSTTAWFGLVLNDYTLFWDIIRESYEALTIYSFFAFGSLFWRVSENGCCFELQTITASCCFFEFLFF